MDQLVEDVMTKENIITSDINTDLDRAKEILLKNRVEKLPIVDDDFKLIGLITIKDIDNLTNYPNACKDNRGRLRVGAGIGVGNESLERIQALVEEGVDMVALDAERGEAAGGKDKFSEVRNAYPDI